MYIYSYLTKYLVTCWGRVFFQSACLMRLLLLDMMPGCCFSLAKALREVADGFVELVAEGGRWTATRSSLLFCLRLFLPLKHTRQRG